MDLSSIELLTETVTVGDQKIEVCGLTTRAVKNLFQRYPALASLLTANGMNGEVLIEVGPDAIAATIAAGLGKAADADTEAAADTLALQQQIDLVEPIVRLTTGGLLPFAERLAKTFGILALSAG
jgi:hypothetical protein